MRGETLALFLAVLSSSSIYGIIALATLLAYARTWGQPTATQPRLGISAQSVGAAAVIRDASSGTTRHRRPGGRSSPSWTGRRQHSSGSLHKSAARAVQGKPRGAGVRWTPSTTSLPRRGDSPPPTRRHHRHAATEAGGKRPPVPPAQRTHSANERTALLADDEQARVRMLGRPQDGSGTGSDEMLLGASAFSPTDTSPLLDAAGGAADVGDTGYGDAPSSNPRGGTDAGDAAVHGGAGGAGPGTGAPGLARSGGGSGSGNGSGPLVTQLASVLAQAHADAQLALARGAGAGAGGADGRSLSSDARRPPALQRVPSATSLASQQSYMSMARPRTFTAPELQAAELRAMKQTQGWVLEAVTYVVMLGVVVSQAVLLGNLVVTGALVLKEGDAQRWFTVQRIALLVAWVANFLVIVVEDCKRVPRGGPTLSWWPVAWAVDLWFLLQHGWRGFSGTPPTTPELEPLCRTCNTLLPLSFAFNSLAVLLCIVYLCRQYNTSDADVYRDALARMDLPHDTRWRRLMRLLGRDRVLVATAILGALLESGVVLLFNILWGRLIDHIESGDRQALNQMSEALAVAALGIGVAVFAEGWCSIVAGARLVLRLQSIAFASLMEEHDQAYIDTQGPDTLATIINDAAPGLKTGMTVSVAQAIEGSVTCVVVISYLAFVSWRLTLIALAGAAVPLMVSAVGGRAVRTRAQAAEVVLEEQEDLALHYMRHSLTLRSCGNESAATATYKGASVRSYGVAKTAATAASALNGFNSGILYGVFVFVFWVGGNMSIDGDIHVGFLVSCALLAFQLIDGIGRVAGAVPAVLTAVDTAKSVLQVLAPQHGARQDDADSPPGRRQSVRGIVGHLKLIDVRFSYPTLPDAEVLSGVNLLLQPGARVALVGERGCGKSTLLMLLQGLYRATRGRVMVDGQDITWLNQKWLRSQVGLAPERPALLRGTVASNIGLGLPGGQATPVAIEAAARLVLAHEWIMALPLGYATPIDADDEELEDEPVLTREGSIARRRASVSASHVLQTAAAATLTDAQRQQIGLARVALKAPHLLLLDDATSCLDERTAADVHLRLTKAFPRCTAVVATRRVRVIQTCSSVAVLQRGQVVQHGTHSELLQDASGPYLHLIRGVPVLQSAAARGDGAADGAGAGAGAGAGEGAGAGAAGGNRASQPSASAPLARGTGRVATLEIEANTAAATQQPGPDAASRQGSGTPGSRGRIATPTSQRSRGAGPAPSKALDPLVDAVVAALDGARSGADRDVGAGAGVELGTQGAGGRTRDLARAADLLRGCSTAEVEAFAQLLAQRLARARQV